MYRKYQGGNNMRLTSTDKAILETIKEFGLLSTSQIERLFSMSKRNVYNRMNFLMSEFNVKKVQYNPSLNFYSNDYKQKLRNENVYYLGRKPKSIEHDLLMNEWYITLIELADRYSFTIKEYKREYKIVKDIEDEDYPFVVIPDAYLLIEYDGEEYEYLVELENQKGFSYKKYYKLEELGVLVPPVIVITNRRVINGCKYLQVIKLHLNMDNVNKFVDDFRLQLGKCKIKY